jgi:hypothetical protein
MHPNDPMHASLGLNFGSLGLNFGSSTRGRVMGSFHGGEFLRSTRAHM